MEEATQHLFVVIVVVSCAQPFDWIKKTFFEKQEPEESK
jgi:hypothetical protein